MQISVVVANIIIIVLYYSEIIKYLEEHVIKYIFSFIFVVKYVTC